MFLVQCNSCNTIGFTDNGMRLDAAVECDCCTEDHDHGDAANKTNQPCRPVTITALPGTIPMTVQ